MSKYFIAVVPPQNMRDELLKLKTHFAEKYNSKGALLSPAHITLHMPFELEGEKEKRFSAQFKNLAKDFSAFTIQLENFGCFEPRVIYLSVKPCETLNELQKKSAQFMKTKFFIFNQAESERGFHPHVTLAFRDLKKPAFYDAWKEFSEKKFSADFQCNSVCLLKHNSKCWEIEQECLFS